MSKKPLTKIPAAQPVERFTCDGVYPGRCMYLISGLSYAQIDQALEKGARGSDARRLFHDITQSLGQLNEWPDKDIERKLRNVWINKGYVVLHHMTQDDTTELAIYHHGGTFHLAMIRSRA